MCVFASVCVSVSVSLGYMLNFATVEPANGKAAAVSPSLGRDPGSLGRRKPWSWSCWRLPLLTASLSTEKGQKKILAKTMFLLFFEEFQHKKYIHQII